MLTHIHMVVYTWWGWHIYKGDEVGVDVDQLGEEMEAKGETPPVECPPIECGQSATKGQTVHQCPKSNPSYLRPPPCFQLLLCKCANTTK